jgi:hypothetical protein
MFSVPMAQKNSFEFIYEAHMEASPVFEKKSRRLNGELAKQGSKSIGYCCSANGIQVTTGFEGISMEDVAKTISSSANYRVSVLSRKIALCFWTIL